jgi:hypothetical protein
MDMRIVGVPVIDRDPIEFGFEILLGIDHQLSGKGAEIVEFCGVLGRNDEAKMMAIIRAPVGKCALVSLIGPRIEQFGVAPISRHTFTFEVVCVFGQRRRRPRSCAPMADHAGIDYHPT